MATEQNTSVLAPVDAGQRRVRDGATIAEALEANRIVFYPLCPIPLPSAADLHYLRSDLPARLRLKNVSYHPEADRVTGVDANPAERERLRGILAGHLHAVSAYLREQIDYLTKDWTIGTCSFRPIQERGRGLKPHASNELVHVDAGAYGATDGDRILRFFVNVSESEDRIWATKGPIDDIVARFGREAGLIDAAGRLALPIDKGAPDHLRSAILRLLARVHPLARVLDSTPYDRAMRRLHNYMKDNPSFQSDPRGHEELRFGPGSAWMVFTDGLSHASLSGQFALVTTLILRRRHMRHPQFAPFNVLAGYRNPQAARPAAH